MCGLCVVGGRPLGAAALPHLSIPLPLPACLCGPRTRFPKPSRDPVSPAPFPLCSLHHCRPCTLTPPTAAAATLPLARRWRAPFAEPALAASIVAPPFPAPLGPAVYAIAPVLHAHARLAVASPPNLIRCVSSRPALSSVNCSWYHNCSCLEAHTCKHGLLQALGWKGRREQAGGGGAA